MSGEQDQTANRPLTLLFTSAGRRVSLLREFRRAGREAGMNVRICAADCHPLAPALQEADEVIVVPPVDRPQYVDELIRFCENRNVDAVIPLIDPELKVLAEARDRFTAIGTRPMISAPETVRICIDKCRTSEFLQQHGFATPHILSDAELATPNFPLFLKPRIGSSSLGAHRINSQASLVYHRQAGVDIIVQEFIEGDEYTVDVFADFSGKARCAIPRRRREVRGGEVSKGQATRHDRMMAEACRLVETLGGCLGMITIQCFLTPADEIVFIEINPRFGGGVPLSIRAGADSPRWILELLQGRDPAIDMNGWTDGMLMLRYDEGIFVMPEDLPEP